MARISEALRHQIRERAKGRCEYCQTQQKIVVSIKALIFPLYCDSLAKQTLV